MKPPVPPLFVAAALRKLGHSFRAQAAAAGYTSRNFHLKLHDPTWDRWPIGRAERWLRIAGLDLWEFRLPARGLRWHPTEDRAALVALLGNSKDAQIRQLAEELNGQVGAQTVPEAA